jgi:hypothetical protein
MDHHKAEKGHFGLEYAGFLVFPLRGKHDASAVCHELRSVCPRNAEVINIEIARDDRDHGGERLTFR